MPAARFYRGEDKQQKDTAQGDFIEVEVPFTDELWLDELIESFHLDSIQKVTHHEQI